MHLLIPFAAPGSEGGRQALRALALPHLQSLAGRLAAGTPDDGAETSLTPPHERALARALGLAGADGCLPWAAWQAPADGLAPGDRAWGLLTPAHWHLGTEQVSLLDPATLVLDDATSRALFDAVQDLFTSEGFAIHWGAPQRWYVAHDSLAALPCASLDRVIGRNVDRWLVDHPTVRLVRRLQSEVQMVLYGHPINERREAQGLLPVNSFWLSGCGVAQPVRGCAPVIDDRLRRAALSEDWDGWLRSWQLLDAGPLAELEAAARRGDGVRLTLCGERSAVTLAPVTAPGWQRVARLWRRPEVLPMLEAL